MTKNKKRKEMVDKYDGTTTAKKCLTNLFLYTDMNIKEFCRTAKTYKEYIAKTLNTIEEDRKKDNLPYYCDISNRVIKITEIDNILTLNRLLFNTLSAFDAFVGYIANELKHNAYSELKELVDNIKPLLNAKIIDTEQDFDLMELLHQARNALIHSGDFICKFATIPSGAKNVVVPAIVIIPSEIFSEQYCKDHNIVDDSCVDTFEVFNNYLETFGKIDIKQILQ